MTQETAMFIVKQELEKAVAEHGPMVSDHDGYAVILEELDELWDEVKKRPALRSQESMELEAMQVATMAIRFLMDRC